MMEDIWVLVFAVLALAFGALVYYGAAMYWFG